VAKKRGITGTARGEGGGDKEGSQRGGGRISPSKTQKKKKKKRKRGSKRYRTPREELLRKRVKKFLGGRDPCENQGE